MCDVLLRIILGTSRKVEDLAEQKMIAQRECKSYVSLLGNAQSKLNQLAQIAKEGEQEYQASKTSPLRASMGESERLVTELKKHKKYIHSLKFRRAAIVVLAANRLFQSVSKGKKRNFRYGLMLSKCVISHHFNESLTSEALEMPELANSLPFLSILPVSQFLGDRISQSILKFLQQAPDSSKFWPPNEECKLVVQTMGELQKLNKDEEQLNGKRKDFSYHGFVGHDTVAQILQQGLSNIKSKYSWLHLGIPPELQSADIKYIDQLFFKDLVAQENHKMIEKALAQLMQISQLCSQLAASKERENEIENRLKSKQEETKVYEENIKKLMNALDEMQNKQSIMVPQEAYDELRETLAHKEEEIHSLSTEAVFSLL